MLDILAITGPIYIAIALGYCLTRAGLFSRADMRVLGQFVIHVALPALLFNLQRADFQSKDVRWALALLIDSVSGTDLRWRSYEYDTTLAAKLTINYTTSSGQPTAARARFVPGMRRPHGHQGW